jgi:hypothetical protein
LGRVERDGVSDADAAVVARHVALGRQLFGHLRPETVHEDQLDAHRMQDRKVLHEGVQLARGDGLAGQRDHEGLAAVGMDVGRHGAKPGYEGVWKNEAHGGLDESVDCAAACPPDRCAARGRR